VTPTPRPGAAPATLHFVVPVGIDDPTRPTGGNIYDHRVRDGLAGVGWEVRELAAPGRWPHPEPSDLDSLRGLLAEVPDGDLVLVDGLIGSAASEVVHPESERLYLVVLVHMPFDTAGERRLLEAAPAVVTTSRWTREWLLENYGLPEALITVAQPGVDPADPAAGTDGGGELLCVAAVTPGKGHDVLVAALARVPDLDWRLTLVGPLDRDPTYVEAVRGQVEDLGLSRRVRFAGTCSREEVEKAYAEADVVLLASRGESFGMVVTEALAHALPVVAGAVGGVPEALGHAGDGTTPGLLVPPDDVDALASALRCWLTEPQHRQRLRRAAGQRRLTLIGWHRTTAELSAVLSRVLEVAR
jgi:glycosyltransferase involved in cell wall biosynthesis